MKLITYEYFMRNENIMGKHRELDRRFQIDSLKVWVLRIMSYETGTLLVIFEGAKAILESSALKKFFN